VSDKGISLGFAGLSGARSAGLEPATFSVRSQTHLRTGGHREGHGKTKPRFYQVLALLEGQRRTGRDTGLWYRCGTKGERHSGIPSSRELEGFIARRKGLGILAGTANAAPSYFLVLGRRAIRQTIAPTAPMRRHTPELPCRSGVLQRWASLPRRFWPFAPVL
jgi:hypothetical protein